MLKSISSFHRSRRTLLLLSSKSKSKQCYQEELRPRRLTVCRILHQNWKQPSGYNTGIVIYNPVVKEKVPLITHHEKTIKWYACGPTVYDSAHIGHASSYVRQDIVRRILQNSFGIDCLFVLGMTDVDDKIINRSKEMKQSIGEITQMYETEFFSDMSRLNVLHPCLITRVTEHMQTIISFIHRLEKQGFTYKASDGSVYFDVNKYDQYGVFSNPQQHEEEHGDGAVKMSSKDFALWKATKPGEPKWDSPWGDGRPGWHIECSAMASSILGSNFDLHSGGEDLMFPHHENELAQSCAFHNTSQWVNYWFHTGQLYLSGHSDKMSKSLKNTVSVSEFLEGYTSNHFRMLCLLTNYRKRVEFSDERMGKAVSTVNSFNNFIQKCDAYAKGQADSVIAISEPEFYQRLEDAKKAVLKAYADDFNTPQALANMMRLVKFASQAFGKGDEEEEEQPVSSKVSQARSPAVMSSISLFIQCQLELLGLELGQRKSDEGSSKSQVQFDDLVDLAVSSRTKIRNVAKDKKHFLETAADLDIPKEKAAILMKKAFGSLWNLSDEIRVQLLKRADVELRDGKEGSTWSVVQKVQKKKLQHSDQNIKDDKETTS